MDDTVKAAMEYGEKAAAEFKHHGVKGMKWGIRNGKGGLSKSEFKKKVMQGHNAKRNMKKVNAKTSSSHVSSMSDHELRTAINRIQMEKQFKSLTGSSSNKQKAAKFVSEIGSTAVKTALTAAATKHVGKAISAAIK